MIYKNHLGRYEIWVTKKLRIQFPFVLLKTYNNLLSDFNRHEDHYWKQFSLNGQWERKFRALEKELKILQSKAGG